MAGRNAISMIKFNPRGQAWLAASAVLITAALG
jgi:hypothetical protein